MHNRRRLYSSRSTSDVSLTDAAAPELGLGRRTRGYSIYKSESEENDFISCKM